MPLPLSYILNLVVLLAMPLCLPEFPSLPLKRVPIATVLLCCGLSTPTNLIRLLLYRSLSSV